MMITSKYKAITLKNILLTLCLGFISHSSYADITYEVWSKATKPVRLYDVPYSQWKIAQQYDPRRLSSNTSLCGDDKVEFSWRKNIKERCQNKSIEQYISWLTKSANNKNTFEDDPARTHLLAQSQFELADNYRNGYGVAKNYTKAIEFYKKAIQNRSGNALIRLGEMYTLGQGVKPDYAQAEQFYLEVLNKNSGDQQIASFYLAKLYQQQLNDLNKAIIWYKKTYDTMKSNRSSYDDIRGENRQQVYSSPYLLAEIYYTGMNNESDYSNALQWYQNTLKYADEVSDDVPLIDIYLKLGWMYLKGYGTQANFLQAYDYYGQAIERLNKQFGENIELSLKNKLTPEHLQTITLIADVYKNNFSIESLNKLSVIGFETGDILFAKAIDTYKKQKGKLFNYSTNDENEQKDAAYYWFEKAIINNSAQANYVFGTMSENPWIFNSPHSMREHDKGLVYYKKADELGSMEGKFALAKYNEMYKNDCQHAAELYQEVLNKGDGETKALAEFNLGRLYYHGNGVGQNSKQAWILLDSAAKANLPIAQKFLFSISDNDPDAKWLKEAFEQAKQDRSYSSPILIIQ